MSAAAGAAAVAATATGVACATGTGVVAATLMLRATRRRRPARSISISVRLVSSSRSASSRISADSSLENFAAALSSGWRAMFLDPNVLCDEGASGFGLDAELGGEALDGEAVALDAEAAERGEGRARGVGVVTETLAGVDVGHVHFDGRNLHREQRVMQGDRGVRIAAGTDDDALHLARMRLVDEVDQLALAVGLPAIGLEAELRRGLPAQCLDVGQRGMAVLLGLARPEHVGVRPVENEDRVGCWFGHSYPGRWFRRGGGY